MSDPASNPSLPDPSVPRGSTPSAGEGGGGEGGAHLHMIAVEPDHGAGAPAIAAELVIHALLIALHHPDPTARRARIDRAIAAIRAEPRATNQPARPARRPFRLSRQYRWILAAAPILALGAVIIILAIPGNSAALAEVRQSIAALRGADHRYEVRVTPWGAPPRPGPAAVIDMRAGARAEGGAGAGGGNRSRGDGIGADGGGGLLAVEHWPPGSRTSAFVGRDAKGEWAIRRDGTVERDRPRQFWPPWSVDDQSLIVDSVDKLLTQLEKRYTLQRPDRAPLPNSAPDAAKPARTFDHVTAERDDREGPLPHYVELWLDPATSLPERVEMRWDPPANDPGDDHPPPPHPDDDDRPPPPHDDGPPPPPPDEGAPYDDASPPPPPPDDRPRPDRGPRPPHRRPPRPKLIVLEHVQAPPHTDDWFTPEAHLPGPRP